MRKLTLAALCGLMALPASVYAEEGNAKVYYKDGTRLEFADADVKFNVQLQPRYTYTDEDHDAADVDEEDSSSFSMRRARFIVSGNVLDKQFSFQLSNDFASDAGGGDLKDAWVQWNGEPLSVRFGQMKVPFGRQQRISSTRLFFPERSTISDFLSHDRELGVMAFTEGGPVNFYTGLYNGDSEGEELNRVGLDTKHNFYAAVDYSSANFGSRGYEGDFRTEDRSLGFTVGASLLYGEGSEESVFGDQGDFDQIGLNADFALRVAGAELQAEYFWRKIEADDVDLEIDRQGFYVQATYIMDRIGLGARFGHFSPDDDVLAYSDRDDIQEYTVGVDYFINGHYLKVQNAVTFEVFDVKDGKDVTDVFYRLQLAGYF